MFSELIAQTLGAIIFRIGIALLCVLGVFLGVPHLLWVAFQYDPGFIDYLLSLFAGTGVGLWALKQ